MAECPNVLYVAVDDLRPDLGCYGHPTVESPNIDALSNEGRQFDRAYCQGPWCAPSRVSCLSGLYPQALPSIRQPIHDMFPELVTLPQWFRQQGHTAVRVGKLYHVGVPVDVGSDGIDDPQSWDVRSNPAGIDVFDTVESADDRLYRVGESRGGLATEGHEAAHTDAMIANEAVEHLEHFAETGEPFFLATGFYRPHGPRIALQRDFDRYDLDDITPPEDEVPDGYRETLTPPVERLVFEREQESLDDLSVQAQREYVRAYYAAITFLDRQVGRVLDALERTGLREETIVVFHADHGYHHGENARLHKTTLFEHTLHVPLIIAPPETAEPGTSTDALTELVDVYPTIVDLCDAAPPEHLAGSTQRPVLEDPDVQVRDSAIANQRDHERGVTIRTDRYRYTEYHEDDRVYAELYDHSVDPGEYDNLAGESSYETVQAELRERLHHRHQAALFDPLEAPRYK
jgi:arylsulfatase A-like enzyme